MAKGQPLLLGYQVTMSGETVWQGLAAILPIFHWTVLVLEAIRYAYKRTLCGGPETANL